MAGHPIPAVELRELTKRFGDVLANAGVNLKVGRGTIHGLIGENGAGKSTAMKLLYGMYRPDSGEILVNGEGRSWSSPSDAIACGLGMVHQHFMLAGPYSALDNILLGAERARWGMIGREKARHRLEQLAGQYGLAVNWEQPTDQLAVGEQQRIEILKLLYREAEILILDEPTAVLTPQETSALFQNLRRLRDEGKTVLLVTHKLREVMAITERVTVFREGKVAGEVETRGTSPEELAFLMIGRKVLLTPEARSALGDEPVSGKSGADGSTQRSARPTLPGATRGVDRSKCPALEAAGLALKGTGGSRHRLSDVSFSVSQGEIVGVAGVEGNGQTELLQALLHPRDPLCRTLGSVRMLGFDVTKWPAAKIRGLGVAVIPEDRLREGIMVEQSVTENFLLGLQRNVRFRKGAFLDAAAVENATAKAIQDYDVRPRNPGLPSGKLSGGNQQKLIVAREFERQPKLLVAAQPTRGVDVGAIEFIHQQIIRARNAGTGVLLVSSELDEILALSDRVLVMFEGRLTAEFSRGQVSERELGLKMGGV